MTIVNPAVAELTISSVRHTLERHQASFLYRLAPRLLNDVQACSHDVSGQITILTTRVTHDARYVWLM